MKDAIRDSSAGTLAQLRAAVHRDPNGVAREAALLAAEARARGDRPALSAALSILGRARRSLGEIDLAETDLAGALETAGDDPELAADASIGLAGVLSFAGRAAEAFALLDTADRLGSPGLRTYAGLQRAIISQRLGLIDEALAGYETALPGLRAMGAGVDVALVLMNRGAIRTQTGACEAAVADLSEANRLFAADGHAFGVAQTCHGLGWAHARQGDLPRALHQLDEAAERFRRLGHAGLEVDIDRVEVLLAAGLVAPAGELARELADRLATAGSHSQAAETWLLSAQAALLNGDRARSAAQAERARAVYARQGCPAGELAARLAVLRAGTGPRDVGELRGLGAALEQAGNTRGASSALALACVAACDADDTEQARELAADCAGLAEGLGVFEVRTLARYALAREAEHRDDPAAARGHVRAGLDDLHRHRAGLAAADARASVALHAAELSALGLRLARRTGSPEAVWAAMELVLAGRARPQPARPPEDGALAAAMTALRSVAARLREHEAAERDTGDLLRRQAELERSIHRRRLQVAADGEGQRPEPPAMDEVEAALCGATLLELAEIDGRVSGVVLGAGPARLVDLGPAAALADVAATVSAALRRSMRGGGRPELLDRALRELDRVISSPLAGTGPVVLVVPPTLHAVPWAAVPALAGRPVVVAPSAAWWLRAVDDPRDPDPGRPVSVVSGPRLAQAEPEALAVAGCHPRARLLTGPAATAPAVLAALAGSQLAHIASHGRIRSDNPLWSSLELFDGPLYVYDLEGLRRTPPVVVLSGCQTGVGVRAGDELLGLSTALLGNGTRSLVAAVCELPDSVATRETMTALHRRLAAGLTPSAALAELAAGPATDECTLLASGLSCFGAQ